MNEAFVAVATGAAGRVADVMAALPFQAGGGYDPRPVVSAAGASLAELREAARGLDGPMVLDAAGRPDPFGVDVAGLMSFLQLVEVLYHGLAAVPKSMEVAAGRNLSATFLIARKVRDRGRLKSKG